MECLNLDAKNAPRVLYLMQEGKWIVACLCAAWCDVCCQFRPSFEELAKQHPDKQFLWIDIEDQADLVGDFDVENFPTLLLQQGKNVAFFGTTLPDARQLNRLIEAASTQSAEELHKEAHGSPQRRAWQSESNLLERLREGV